jgi:CRP-like cAMP-binding protein
MLETPTEIDWRMTDWEKISRLCREALARDTVEREAFLDEACEGDVELRHELALLFEPAAKGDNSSGWLIAGLGRLLDELNSTEELARENADTRLDKKSNRIFFRSSPFSILGAATLAELLAVMQLHEYAAGDHLIEQGDPAEFLLLILTGTAWARVRDTPQDRPPVGKFGPGDIVGEMSLITDEPRTADVVAETPVRALQLSTSDFHVLTERHPDLRVVLTDVMADRLGHAKFDGLGGKDIHGYQVVQCVGRGGMGVVYEALDVAKGTRVALKMMNHRLIYQPNALRRFRREAAILARTAFRWRSWLAPRRASLPTRPSSWRWNSARGQRWPRQSARAGRSARRSSAG